jgi:hypothetical protein
LAVVKKPANYHWTDYSNFVTSDKTFIQIPAMYQYSDMSNQPVKSPGRCLKTSKSQKNHIKKCHIRETKICIAGIMKISEEIVGDLYG